MRIYQENFDIEWNKNSGAQSQFQNSLLTAVKPAKSKP